MANPPKTSDDFIISMSDMPKGGKRSFDLTFTYDMRRNARDTLTIVEVRKLRIKGTLMPEGKKDWLLQVEIGASVTQACVLTLAPVKTRIDTSARRLLLTDWEEPEGDSVQEMTLDEETEPLGHEINLELVAIETIALALPPYPRSDAANLEKQVFAEPGVKPMTDEDAKPFAALAALMAKKND